MGGYNSGRHGGRPTVESSLVLDLNKLIRDRFFRPGCDWGGSIVWTNVGSGKSIATIGYQAYMGDGYGRVRLYYTSTDRWTGEKRDSDYTIELATTDQPFGGHRWWFVCPKAGDLVSKLHLPPGALTFASRRAYRLGYRSQRETPSDRALSRAQNLRYRLGGSMSLMDAIPEKPKGMRWRTYDRKVAQIEAAERVSNAHLWLFVKKLQHRMRRS